MTVVGPGGDDTIDLVELRRDAELAKGITGFADNVLVLISRLEVAEREVRRLRANSGWCEECDHQSAECHHAGGSDG